MTLFFVSFLVLLIAGVPISISIGASAVLGCLQLGYPMMVIGQKMVTGIDSYLLIAIPLFILAGNLMNSGKITEKIFNFAKEVVGWIPGGLGHANRAVTIGVGLHRAHHLHPGSQLGLKGARVAADGAKVNLHPRPASVGVLRECHDNPPSSPANRQTPRRGT